MDIQNTSNDERPTATYVEQNSNINSFFNRRKIQSKKTLFKFDKSSHTAEETTIKEHKRNASDMSNDEQLLSALSSNERNKLDKSLVCQPDPALIRKIYLPLVGYIHEIEELMKIKPGQPSAFNEFLSTHIKEVFLDKGHNRNLQLTIESLSKNHDAWRTIITPEEMKNMGLTRPLLQSTVLVENSKRIFINFI